MVCSQRICNGHAVAALLINLSFRLAYTFDMCPDNLQLPPLLL